MPAGAQSCNYRVAPIHRLHLHPARRPRTRTHELQGPILTDRLAAALERLNPWLSDTNVTRAVKAVTQVSAASLVEANETLYTSLTYGIALEQDRGDERKSHTVRFLDFDKSNRNEWVDDVVVHELVHLRHRGHGRDYWQAVGRVMPDYERRREDLRWCGEGLS